MCVHRWEPAAAADELTDNIRQLESTATKYMESLLVRLAKLNDSLQ